MTDETPPPGLVARLRGWRDVTATRDSALAALLIECHMVNGKLVGDAA